MTEEHPEALLPLRPLVLGRMSGPVDREEARKTAELYESDGLQLWQQKQYGHNRTEVGCRLWRTWQRACLCRLYYGYLRLLEKTVRLEVEMPKDMDHDTGALSLFPGMRTASVMNLLLRKGLSEGRIAA